MAYFCFYYFFFLYIISEYLEFENYVENKLMIKTLFYLIIRRKPYFFPILYQLKKKCL